MWAFSPGGVWRLVPGAVPQAGIECAVGAEASEYWSAGLDLPLSAFGGMPIWKPALQIG